LFDEKVLENMWIKVCEVRSVNLRDFILYGIYRKVAAAANVTNFFHLPNWLIARFMVSKQAR